MVPVFELPNGAIITESKVQMDFLEDAYPGQGYSLLPEDPVKRAFMRIAINLVENLNSVWYPIYFKKAYDEADFKNLKEKLQKIEDFIAANANEGSPFAQGTPNPTQLDVHIYAHVERLRMLQGSAWNDLFWKNLGFEKYPRIVKLLDGIRARPEFRGILANPKPYHQFVAQVAEKPPGVRVQLNLPISNDE